jgi:polysaccharide biosynthesis/export protein
MILVRHMLLSKLYKHSRSCLFATMVALNGCATPVLSPDVFQASMNEAYTLSSGDRLRIIVFGQDTLSNAYIVDGTGRISFPLIGLVECKGLSTAQLETQIAHRLRNGFLREPRVSVEVEQYRPFFILGEVNQSGQYPYVNGSTIQTGVAIAGGFSPRGARSYAEVTRNVNGKPTTASVPITFPLRPGDTITIKERLF